MNAEEMAKLPRAVQTCIHKLQSEATWTAESKLPEIIADFYQYTRYVRGLEMKNELCDLIDKMEERP